MRSDLLEVLRNAREIYAIESAEPRPFQASQALDRAGTDRFSFYALRDVFQIGSGISDMTDWELREIPRADRVEAFSRAIDYVISRAP